MPPRAGERDIEVEGSHLGMGWNPKVLRLVGERLARTPLASLPARVLRSGTGSHDHAVKHPC